jgi:hypothetical protein
MATLQEMKQANKMFFKNGKGKGEKYNVHKDHLIITQYDDILENTVFKVWEYIEFDDGTTRFERVNFYLKNVNDAKRFIDQKLEIGKMDDHEYVQMVMGTSLSELQRVFAADPLKAYLNVSNVEYMAIWAVRVSAYLLELRCSGSHASAVSEQNEKACKVRKALGYSYPKQDINF